MKAKGDKSKKVKSVKRSAGPSQSKGSMAKRPKGKPVLMKGGAQAYHGKDW